MGMVMTATRAPNTRSSSKLTDDRFKIERTRKWCGGDTSTSALSIEHLRTSSPPSPAADLVRARHLLRWATMSSHCIQAGTKKERDTEHVAPMRPRHASTRGNTMAVVRAPATSENERTRRPPDSSDGSRLGIK
eukprot:scaffold286915_cov30-Tisochrysis_lutea.AAC.2